CCSLVGLGALLIEERGRPPIAVYAGVHIPARGGATAPALSIVEEFADDARDGAGTVSNRGGPSLYSRQEFAESQRCWLRSCGRGLLAPRTRALLARDGIECPTGPGPFEFETASGVYTELQCGSYPNRLALGDKIRLIPGHCDPTVNLCDWYVCI